MTTTLQDIAPGKIKPHPRNPRGAVGDVTELAASIRQKGVLEPLLVVPNLPGPTFVLIAGHRRLAAAKEAKVKTVPCIVREDLTDPAEQLETALVENLQRTDLTPLEEASAYQQLLEFPGYTIKRITTSTGRSAATVKSRLAIAKLPATIHKKIQTGQVTLADAQALTEFADDPAALTRLEKALATGNWRWELERAQKGRRRDKQLAAEQARLRKAGVRVVTDDDLEQIIENLPAGTVNEIGWAHVGPDYLGTDYQVYKTPEDHAACPGHAALVEEKFSYGMSGKLTQTVYVCTSPQLHPELTEDSDDAGDGGETKAQQRAADAAAMQAQRVAEDLQVAATVRRRHLIEFGNDTINAMNVATQLLRDTLLDLCDNFAMARIIGPLTSPDVDASTYTAAASKARKAAITDYVNTLAIPALAVMLDLATHADTDTSLERPEGWGPTPQTSQHYKPYEKTLPWRAKLADVYGYQFSDVEAQLNMPPAIVDVNLPDDDAGEDA